MDTQPYNEHPRSSRDHAIERVFTASAHASLAIAIHGPLIAMRSVRDPRDLNHDGQGAEDRIRGG